MTCVVPNCTVLLHKVQSILDAKELPNRMNESRLALILAVITFLLVLIFALPVF
jgi:hypothetical protein